MTQVLVEVPDFVTPQEVRRMVALSLFEQQRVSLGRGAEIAGMAKGDFMTYVSDMGVPVVNYPPEELYRELEILERKANGPAT